MRRALTGEKLGGKTRLVPNRPHLDQVLPQTRIPPLRYGQLEFLGQNVPIEALLAIPTYVVDDEKVAKMGIAHSQLVPQLHVVVRQQLDVHVAPARRGAI
jgi:hypothetical protein